MEILSGSFIELLIAIQAGIAIYILYIMIINKQPLRLITLYFIVLILFIGLKFNIIPYKLGGILDQFLWGMYNILYSLSFIYLLGYQKWKK